MYKQGLILGLGRLYLNTFKIRGEKPFVGPWVLTFCWENSLGGRGLIAGEGNGTDTPDSLERQSSRAVSSPKLSR